MAPAYPPPWLTNLAHQLRCDHIGALATDTVLGLTGRCVMGMQSRLNQLKERPEQQPLVVLVNGWAMAHSVALIPDGVWLHWPASVTYIMPTQPAHIDLFGPTIAIRYPQAWWLTEIITQVGGPLFSTSLNRTGETPAQTASDIPADIRAKLGFIWEQGVVTQSLPSTLVSLLGATPQLVRHGRGPTS